jgi:protease PrsW
MVWSVLLVLALSFVPMVFYAVVLWSLDRYEKEPLSLLVASFLWGAIPSVILALILQIVLDIPLLAVAGSSQLTYDLLGSSVVAPLTEEGVKALALMLLLLVLHREIDSPVDGLIYGGMIGFGFAAVENVFYLLGALAEGGVGGAVGLALLRAGVFGLNHAMYTGFTGLGVALALELRSKWLGALSIMVGFAFSVGAHALHNALATFIAYGGLMALLLAVVVDWVGVLALVGVAAAAFFVERRRIRAYATTLLAPAGITQDEIAMLLSTFRRRQARLKLLFAGNLRGWWRMHRYQRKVSEAAFAYHRIERGDGRSLERLAKLEQDYRLLRQELSLC